MRYLMLLGLVLALVGCGGSMPPPVDDGGTGDGGLPFGSVCAAGTDCASGVCFVGGNRSFCSLHCTMDTAATDCPVPPTSGACNMQGYCKP